MSENDVDAVAYIASSGDSATAIREKLRTLASLPNPSLFAQVATQLPFLFDDLLDALLKAATLSSADSDAIQACIRILVSLFPAKAVHIRRKLLDKGLFLAVVLLIALTREDHLSFMNAIVSYEYLPFFTKHANDKGLIEAIRQFKVKLFSRILSKEQSASSISIPEECMLLRLVCVFVGYFKIKLSAEDMEAVMKFVSNEDAMDTGTAHSSGDRLPKMKLCALLVCANQLLSFSQPKFIAALRRVIESDVSELTLMTGVYCHTNQLAHIVALVREELDGVPVGMTADGLEKLRMLFIDRVLREDDIARRALAIPAAQGPDSLGVTVVYELLKAGIFVRVGMDVKQWVSRAIEELQPPFHDKFPDLIKRYVESLLEVPVFSRISESEVTSWVKRGCEISAVQVGMIFLVLQLKERYFAKKSAPASAENVLNPACQEYTESFMDTLPINSVLLFLERRENQEAFRPFYASIVSLVASQFPQIVTPNAFCWSESLVDDEDLIPSLYRKRILYDCMMRSGRHDRMPLFDQFHVTQEVLAAVFRRAVEDPGTLVACLEYLCSMDPSELLGHLDSIVHSFFGAALFRDGFEPDASSLFLKLFACLNAVSPRELWIKTVNAWRLSTPLTREELVQNPLLLFQCRSECFEIADVFLAFLQILDCYLISSRRYYYRKFQLDVYPDKSSKLKETHLHALLELQESAVMQALLEVCTAGFLDERSSAYRINVSACSFLHQRFVLSKNSMKLLHFQGYSENLIDLAVENIASMHVCFEFIPELLAQPQLEKQVFVLQLASRLCLKYPIPTSLTLANNILIPKIKTLSNQISDVEPSINLFSVMDDRKVAQQQLIKLQTLQTNLLKVFACLGTLVEAFPVMIENIDQFVGALRGSRQRNISFLKACDAVTMRVQEVRANPGRFNKILQSIH